VLTALNDGRIQGDNLASDVYGEVKGTSPDIIRLNRSASWGEGIDVNVFKFDPWMVAKIVAHEDRHVQQLRELGWFARIFGGSRGFHKVLEADADGYAGAHLLKP